MSEGTLRREIRAGRVTAEKRRRNPDSLTDLREVYEVLVTDTPASASHSESGQPPDSRQDTPAFSERLLETVLTQAETIAALNREAGEMGAAVDAYRREVEWLKAELENARRPWPQRLKRWLTGE